MNSQNNNFVPPSNPFGGIHGYLQHQSPLSLLPQCSPVATAAGTYVKRAIEYSGVMIPGLEPVPEPDFGHF